MKVHTLVFEQFIDRPLTDVFPFFENPRNLSVITPPNMGFKILTPEPIAMKVGTVIDYVVRILGVPVRWRSIITDYNPPSLFVDQQLKGPYSFWFHRHTFEKSGKGTAVRDEVHYALPFDIAGLVNRFLVRRQLNAIVAYRRKISEN